MKSKNKIILIMIFLFIGIMFISCKDKNIISETEAENNSETLIETPESEINKNRHEDEIIDIRKIIDYIPEEVDVSEFLPVTEEQFACLPGCYITCETDMPLYETQNTDSMQIGVFSANDAGYVKECGIHPNGKQWFYVVDDYSGEKGWLLYEENKKNLKSNIELIDEKNRYTIYNRKNASIAIKNNDDDATIYKDYYSYIFTSDGKYMGDWNSYDQIFKLYDIENGFICKNINLYSRIPYSIDDERWQAAVFSPDGTKIVFACGRWIFGYDIATEKVSLLFKYPLEIFGRISKIFISPDQNLYYFEVDNNNTPSIYSYNVQKAEGHKIEVEPSTFYGTYNAYSNYIFNPQNNDFSFTVWLHDNLLSSDTYINRKLCTVKASEWPKLSSYDIDKGCSTETVSYLPDGNLFFADSSMVKYSVEGKLVNNRRYVSVPDCFDIRMREMISPDGAIVARFLYSFIGQGELSHECRFYFYSTATMNLLFVKEFEIGNDEYLDDVYWNGNSIYFVVSKEDKKMIRSWSVDFIEKEAQEELISENFYRMDRALAYLCARGLEVESLSQGYTEVFLNFAPNGSYEFTESAGESGEFISADVGAYSINNNVVTIYKADYSKHWGEEKIYPPDNNISGEYKVVKSGADSKFGNIKFYKGDSLYAQSDDYSWSNLGKNGEQYELVMERVPEEKIVINRKKTKVKDTMYVNSVDGLKVRDKPSLQSNRICGLTYRFPVKCTAVGKKETIDGISASWIEILLPRCEWSSDEPEYGWVFGGYLSEVQPEFISPGNAEEFKKLLCSYPCWRSSEYPSFCFHFYEDGKFWCGAHEKGEPTVGTYKVINNNHIVITSTFMGFNDDNETTVEDFYVSNVDECSFYYEGPFFSYHKNTTFYGFFYSFDYMSVLEDCKKYPYIYNNFYRSVYEPENINYAIKFFKDEVLNKFISYGISAEGTEYEDLYHEYWNPIMAERQKLADAMK